MAAANLPRSRGIEGMALSSDGRTLYPSLEGALVADPNQNRRVVYAYDLAKRRFRRWTAGYFTDAPGQGHRRSDRRPGSSDDNELVQIRVRA